MMLSPFDGSLDGHESGLERPVRELSKRELLVDVSVILRNDSQTGIQRVVCALLGALLDADIEGYVVRPVFATRKDSYVYVDWGASLLMGRVPPVLVPSG